MVTSSSPTVFESSTMMVLIAPSSILILCGRCFFLYSKISWGEKRRTCHQAGQQTGTHRTSIINHFPYSISQHVVIQGSPGFQPDSLPGIIVRQEESVIWCWKWNMTCRWQSGISSEVNVGCLSCPQTLSRLGFGDSLPDDPAGVVHRGGRLELHRLHHVALAHTDF